MNGTSERRALLSADTDRTQTYVFESAHLPEIRGGSTLLRHLNEESAPQLVESLDKTAKRIYVGGGSLLYEVALDKAPEIQRELEALYPQETRVATVTCVYRELPDSGDSGVPAAAVDEEALGNLSEFQRERFKHADKGLGEFGAWVRLLGHDLRRRKKEKRHLPFVEAASFAERCASCRTRPASGVFRYHEGEKALCPECLQKRGQGARSGWLEEFETWLAKFHSDLSSKYPKEAPPGTPRPAQDLAEIAKFYAPANSSKGDYVAFIYADGDQVGSFVESRKTRADYQKVSGQLRDATWSAVTYGLAKHLRLQSSLDDRDQETGPVHPFEILTVGGDDVMVIVPAPQALAIATDMASQFREHLNEEGVEGTLSLSVGVVIAPVHMPVRLMRDFAAELLKKGAKRRSGAGQAGIDFQVFTSTAVYGSDIMSVRNRAPYSVPSHKGKDHKPVHLYHRPYSLEEARKLVTALEVLKGKGFPKSQLFALAEMLERGRQRATLFYLYQRSRLKPELRGALNAVERIVPPRDEHDPLPWKKAPPKEDYAFSTVLRDVAELYDFTPAPQTEEVEA
jgi:hypothetical protein